MEKIGIFYGSTSGNTEEAANDIKDIFGEENAEVFNVIETSPDEMSNYSNIIVGSSTWGIGDLQDDIDNFIDKMNGMNLGGKKLALYAFGDQESYSESYVEVLKTLNDHFAEAGAEMVGKWSVEGYDDTDELESVDEGMFYGLALDNDNAGEFTDERLKKWTDQLRKEFV